MCLLALCISSCVFWPLWSDYPSHLPVLIGLSFSYWLIGVSLCILGVSPWPGSFCSPFIYSLSLVFVFSYSLHFAGISPQWWASDFSGVLIVDCLSGVLTLFQLARWWSQGGVHLTLLQLAFCFLCWISSALYVRYFLSQCNYAPGIQAIKFGPYRLSFSFSSLPCPCPQILVSSYQIYLYS